MTGHTNAERLSSYLDDELDSKDTRRLEEHLRQCDGCRRQLDGLRRVMSDLRALRESSPPAGLGLELEQRLALDAPPPHERRGALGHRFPRPFFQSAFLGSLGVILALGVIMVMFSQVFANRPAGEFPGRPGTGSTAMRPADRVEVAGRAFEVMGGIWVEHDLTVADVASARVVDRSELLARTDTSTEVREILSRLDRQVTLRVVDEILRVSEAPATNR